MGGNLKSQVLKLRSRRKLCLIIGVVVVVVAALGTWSILPGEAVSLVVSYTKGEKLTYEVTMTMKMGEVSQTIEMILTMEVLDVEDGVYTIKQTMTIAEMDQAFSFTMKFDETGQVLDVEGLPSEAQQTFSSFTGIPGCGMYFPKDRARVKDSWDTPIDIRTGEFNLTGTIHNRITETRKLTVPAGTYDVFKLEIPRSELTATYEPPAELDMASPIQMDMTISGYEFFEKGTCLTIQANFDQTFTVSFGGQTMTMSVTMQMKLVEHSR